MRTYFIRNWSDHFENSESRKVKHARWVCLPNRHDGKTYRRITRHPRAAELFTAWCLILEVASKMPERGKLADEDGPLDADALSDMTGFPVEMFVLAFNVLSTNNFGWICYEDATEVVPERPGAPGESPGTSRRAGVEGNGMEENGREEKDPLTPASGGMVIASPEGAAVKSPAETRAAPKEADGKSPPDEATGARRRKASDPEANSEGFVQFWKAYPPGHRKVAKSKCERHWSRNGLEPLAVRVLTALKSAKRSRDWTKDGGQFIPQPLTWLNQAPWETDAAEMADKSPDGDTFDPFGEPGVPEGHPALLAWEEMGRAQAEHERTAATALRSEP